MALVKSLLSRGMDPSTAELVGFVPITLTTTSSAQGSAGGLITGKTDLMVDAIVASDDDAITLPSGIEPGGAVVIFNKSSANTARIYPPSGHSFNNGTANQYATMEADGLAAAIRLTATRWLVNVSATITLT